MPLTKAEIARVRALREKKHRVAENRFVVEGPKVVAELLAAGFTFEAIYATAAWSGRADHTVSDAEMARLSHFPTPSPVLAIGPVTHATLAPGELARGLTLALDGIQDPGNVGTLLRIADWFGFDRVLLSPDCADLFSQKTINASMGSFARIRAITTALPPALAAAGIPVCGCDLAGTDLHSFVPPAAAVIVIGSEGRGLSAEVKALVNTFVTIPRHGRAESLNAAVAAGIVCDHFRRPRP